MKRLAFWSVVAVAALCAFGETYLVQDDQGTIKKTINGVEYTFSEFTPENFDLIADSAWWYTDDAFKQSEIKVHIEDKPAAQGGKINADIEASPNDSAESIEAKIKAKIPVSAQGAYAAATKALAYALYNKFRVDKLENQMNTVGNSLQTQLLSPYGITAENYRDDSGGSFKVINAEKNASGVNALIEKLKSGRSLFAKDKKGNVSIDGSKLIVEGKVALVSGGGGSSNTDAMSITNFYTDTVGFKSNTLALAGWWTRTRVDKPNKEFICDFSLEDFGKDPDERGAEFNKHFLLTRDSTGKMHYLPMTNSVKATVKVDNCAIKTNEAGEVSLHSFTNGLRDANATLGDILTADKEEEPYIYNWQTNAYVVTRTTEKDGSYQLWYFPIGELRGNTPDNKSIAISQYGDTSNKLEIAGFSTATNTEAEVGVALADKMFSAETTELLLPAKEGEELKWIAVGNYSLTESISGLETIVQTNGEGKVERHFQLAHWNEVTNQASTAYTSIADIINGNDEEKAEISTNLALLAKNLKTSQLEYILLGNFEKGVDNQSVAMTNKLDEATGESNTVYTVYGFLDASSGKVPMKVGTGDEAVLVWTNLTASVDNKSLVITNIVDSASGSTNAVITINGFLEAKDGYIPMKVGTGDEAVLVWTNSVKGASNSVDNLTIQNWRKAGETNDVLMVNGFASKNAEEKGLDTLLGDTKDTSTDNYKFQVLARKMDKGKTLNDTTNGLELVYLDIKDGLLGTNKWKNATGSGNRSDARSYFDPASTNLQSGTEAVQGVALEAKRMIDGNSVSTNINHLGEIYGFSKAEIGTHPVKRNDGTKDFLKWEMEQTADALAIRSIGGSESVQYRTIDYSDEFLLPSNGVFTLWGFAEANDNAIPYKHKIGESSSRELGWLEPPEDATSTKPQCLQFNGTDLVWGDAKQTIRFIGTDGTKVDVGSGTNIKEVSFASASDSNVTVSCETNGVGGAKITIGVYYK